MHKKLAITAFISALFTGGAYAQQFDAKYYTPDESSIKIERLDDRGGTIDYNGAGGYPSGPVINPPMPGPVQLPKPPDGPGGVVPPVGLSDVNDTINVIDSIVNLADKIWSIIEKNQPVVDITTNYANAVPYGTSHWTQLQGWSKPATQKYSFSM